MPSKKKITVKTESPDPVFENLEFTDYADKFIGVIKRHFRMIEGRNIESPEILELATQIIKGRLK